MLMIVLETGYLAVWSISVESKIDFASSQAAISTSDRAAPGRAPKALDAPRRPQYNQPGALRLARPDTCWPSRCLSRLIASTADEMRIPVEAFLLP